MAGECVAQIVVVDPLRTETAEKADVHLAVRPGQDWALLLAMARVILDSLALRYASVVRTIEALTGQAVAGVVHVPSTGETGLAAVELVKLKFPSRSS